MSATTEMRIKFRTCPSCTDQSPNSRWDNSGKDHRKLPNPYEKQYFGSLYYRHQHPETGMKGISTCNIMMHRAMEKVSNYLK